MQLLSEILIQFFLLTEFCNLFGETEATYRLSTRLGKIMNIIEENGKDIRDEIKEGYQEMKEAIRED